MVKFSTQHEKYLRKVRYIPSKSYNMLLYLTLPFLKSLKEITLPNLHSKGHWPIRALHQITSREISLGKSARAFRWLSTLIIANKAISTAKSTISKIATEQRKYIVVDRFHSNLQMLLLPRCPVIGRIVRSKFRSGLIRNHSPVIFTVSKLSTQRPLLFIQLWIYGIKHKRILRTKNLSSNPRRLQKWRLR